MVDVAGITAMEATVALVTVSIAGAEIILPEVAVIVEVPGVRAWTRPFVGSVLLMLPTAAPEEFHVTCDVKFWILPSVNVPVAVNCWFVAGAIETVAGVTAMETREMVTIRVALLLTLPDVAVMVVEPTALPVASPLLAIVATLVSDELHVTELVKSLLLPSLYWPVAVNCCRFEAFTVSVIEGPAGDT